MENKTENDINTLTISQDIKNKAREELNKQLQGLLNNESIPSDDNIEDEVNRLMKEVDLYEKNYVPKDLDINAFNDLKKFEEEFGEEEIEEPENEEEEKEEKEEIHKLNNLKEINRETKDKLSKKEQKKTNKKKKIDLNLKNEDFEDKKNDKKNKNKNNIIQDKEIKELLDEYEKQLNIEVEREVEKEYKPKLDENDIKRADILLKKDPLINEAFIQGMITKEELILFIDYYEIFSLTNKAKKVTNEHLKALDDLCLKKKDREKEKENNLETNKKNVYDLNDEDAINKLTKEIETKMKSSENIFNRKLEYEKIMKNKNVYEDIKKDILKNMNKEKKENINEDKNSYINNKVNDSYNINYKVNDNKNNINEEDRRLQSSKSEINNFTTEELMSVPKYTIYKNNNNKKENSNNNSNNSINSKINNIAQKTQSNNNNIDNEIYKPKTPLNPISRDKNKNNKNNSNNNSMLSHNMGKKTIPPIKNNNLKTKSNKRVDLFDDEGNPLIISKDARKELIKMKMGGKSKMHELFTNKPRNMEENEKLRQKFIDFIQNGKEINKNNEPNTVKKSIVRKKIEDAQMFNKYKK